MDREDIRLFFFGDSICFGQGVAPHKTWVSRLAHALDAEFAPAVDVTVQNASVNGNTTRMALERMAYDVQSHEPDILFVQFGMNDCNYWETDRGNPRVSPAAFKANLAEIIVRGRSFGAQQIILGTNHPTTRTNQLLPHVDFCYEVSNRRYNALSREVAAEMGVQLADIEPVFREQEEAGSISLSETVQADELHLSELGHSIYFDARLPLLRTEIQQLLDTRTFESRKRTA